MYAAEHFDIAHRTILFHDELQDYASLDTGSLGVFRVAQVLVHVSCELVGISALESGFNLDQLERDFGFGNLDLFGFLDFGRCGFGFGRFVFFIVVPLIGGALTLKVVQK